VEHRIFRWPDAKRVLERMDVVEISPVQAGACGPHCRTLPGKSRGGAVEVKCASGACARSARPAGISASEARECLERAEALQEALQKGRPLSIKEVSAMYVDGDDMLCRALAAACKDLKLPPMRLRYFRQGPPNVVGFYAAAISPDSVWVHADAFVWDQLRVVGHEAFHAKRHLGDESADEAGARWYGEKLRHSDPGDWPYYVRPAGYTQST
jgi:hypothetical protein